MKQDQNKAKIQQATNAINSAAIRIAAVKAVGLKASLTNMLNRLSADPEKYRLDIIVAMAKDIERLAEMVIASENQENIEHSEKKRSSAVVLINEIDHTKARKQLYEAIAEMEQAQKSKLNNKNNFK
ncbi:hypothetical protein [Pseudomonas aeruginosa]|uniref:hypothetical protein n=1 Tax=Pseudomonas aeruginosa TaxID=287 RepID=UPI000A87D60A|nr:hypothetical protein [Pseudomonas aeruginosa]MDS9414898.1 hypothetical protein [Pseudomonas aeruginosa]MDS9431370.1 hypothetical protein [Pseudomonas aeruginosa]MDS9497133.1 hypothetical protein [Pseudomonas aeruginosa]MDS9562091.1 hypothetical protein [Pseudomonas aeruginosa]MDS9575221.1 hypothetical protein [Pseudomonas aeruginosa]